MRPDDSAGACTGVHQPPLATRAARLSKVYSKHNEPVVGESRCEMSRVNMSRVNIVSWPSCSPGAPWTGWSALGREAGREAGRGGRARAGLAGGARPSPVMNQMS